MANIEPLFSLGIILDMIMTIIRPIKNVKIALNNLFISSN